MIFDVILTICVSSILIFLCWLLIQVLKGDKDGRED